MALMRLIGGVFLIGLVNQIVSGDDLGKRVQCVSCQGRLSLLDCDQIQTCAEDEICYIEEVIDLGGEMVINAGCRKQHVCDSKGCFNDVTARKKRDVFQPRLHRRSPGELICHHCCDTTLCNMYGCSNTQEVDSLKGSRCIACDMSDHPGQCTSVRTCEAGEHCYTTAMINTAGPATVRKYRTGCMKAEVCAVLDKQHQQQQQNNVRRRRSYMDIYSECCQHHLCNRDIPLITEVPSKLSTNYKCPERNTTAMTDDPNASGVCEDKIDNCAAYTADYICHGDYVPWAKLNCNKFCKFCKPCSDAIAECSLYGFDYICKGDYLPWAMLNCKSYCNLCDADSDRIAPVVTTLPTTATTTTAATTTTTTTTTTAPCEDQIRECSLYGFDYICKEDYIPWSVINCRKFCNLCGITLPPTTTTVTTPAPCEDQIQECSLYGFDYICTEAYIPWSIINCRNFCNLCGITLPPTTTMVTTPEITTPEFCEDKIQECPLYGVDYICKADYIPWALLNCKKYCNLCGQTVTQTTTTKPTTTTTTTTTTAKPTTAKPTTTKQTTTPAPATSAVPCVDKNVNCALYGRGYICVGDYVPWSEINCRAYCGMCEVPTTTPAPPPTSAVPCVDKNVNCALYGRGYICVGDYVPWSEINCRAYCGMCEAAPTTVATTPQTTEEITTTPLTTPIKTTEVTTTTKPTTATTTTTSTPVTSTTPPTTSTILPTTTTPALTSTLKTTTVKLTTKPQTTTQPTTTVPKPTTTPKQTSSEITTATKSTLGSTLLTTTTTRKPTTTTMMTTTTTTSTPVPQTTTDITTEPTTTTEGPCRDTLDCSVYSAKLACHGEFFVWATQHCPKYCGFCIDENEVITTKETTTTTSTTTPSTTTTPTTTTTTPVPTTTTPGDPNCQDKVHCAGLEDRCGDPTEHTWLYENCRRTCHMCEEAPVCVDEIEDCVAMALYICDLGISPELKPKCKKTCDICDT